MTQAQSEVAAPVQARWPRRPWLSGLVRLAATAVPVLLGVAVAVAFAQVVSPFRGSWGGWARALWWIVVVALAGVTMHLTSRVTRRLLPLASLLNMSLLFPGAAPSRIRVASQAASGGNLEQRFSYPGEGETASQAAERLLGLVFALGVHDSQSGGHSERVRAYTELVANQMKLSGPDRDRLQWAALLHDIGKLHLSEELITKSGPPTEFEWERLRLHTVEGDRLLGAFADWLGPWALAVLEHHERWDGDGYPAGRRGDEISAGGRIVAAVDAFEAMTATYSYRRRPLRADEAFQELAANAGSQFDPVVVRAIASLPLPQLRRIAGPSSWLAELPYGSGLRATVRSGRTVRDMTLTAILGSAAIVAGLLPPLSAATNVTAHLALAPATPPADPPTAAQQAKTQQGTAQQPGAPSGGATAPFQLFPGGSSSTLPAPAAPATTATAPTASSPLLQLDPLPAVAASPAPPLAGGGAAPTAADPAPATSVAGAGPVATLPPAPAAAADSTSTVAGSPVRVSVLDNDSLGSTIHLTISTAASHGVAQSDGDGTVTYTPAGGYTGPDRFGYTICDVYGRCSTAEVAASVLAPPAPVAEGDSAATTTGATVFVPVLGNDHLAGPVQLAVTVPPGHGTAVVDFDQTISYTSANGFAGSDGFAYQICDQVGQCSAAMVAVRVRPPAPPVARSVAVSTQPGQDVIADVEAGDTVSPSTVLLVDSPPAHGTATVVGGRAVAYQPNAGYTGTDTMSYELCDAYGQCAFAPLTVDVATTAAAGPVAMGDLAVTSVNRPATVAVLANDQVAVAAGRLFVIAPAAHGTATPMLDGTVSYQPTPAYAGTDGFQYLACDATRRCASAVASVSVLAQAPASPLAGSDLAVTSAGQPVTVNVLANDLGGQAPLIPGTVTVTAGPANGGVSVNRDGTVDYTPGAGFTGTDSWTYQVCNGLAACATGSVAVSVVPPSAPSGPVTLADTAVTPAGTAVAVDVLGNDGPGSSGAPLVATTVAADPAGPAAGHGTVSFDSSGKPTYTPDAGYIGTDRFTYQVCDETARCSSSVVVVTVTP